MLAALGARFLDADGKPVAPGGGPLATLAEADLSGLDPRLKDIDLVLASDVDNPLTGPKRPEVYGRQKGATEEDIAVLDAALTHYASILGPDTPPRCPARARPEASATGRSSPSVPASAPVIEVMLDVLGFAPALARATLVITGEGSLDEQTLHGKAPAGVAAAARTAGIEVVAVCGRLASPGGPGEAGIRRAYALAELEPDPAVSMAQAGRAAGAGGGVDRPDFLTG